MTWLPTYPVDDDVLSALASLPAITSVLTADGALTGTTSSREIVRLLGQAGRGHKGSAAIVAACDRVTSRAPGIGSRVLSAKLWFSFLQSLTEVYVFEFFDRLPGFEPHDHVHGPNTSGHDLDVTWGGGTLKLEVHTPAYLMGYQTLHRAIEHVLMSVTTERGYYLIAHVGPKEDPDTQLHDLFWTERVRSVVEVRDWMAGIGGQIEEWMTVGAHGQISIDGPRDLVLDVRLERWQDEGRALALHPAGQSTDLFVTWRDLSAAAIAGGPFGEHFGNKLNKAQAGGAEAGVLRALVLI